MGSLSKYEQETVINFNAGEQTAVVYTRDKAVMRKLGRNWRDTNAVTNWIFAVRYGNIALDKIMRKLRFVFSASDD